MVVANYSTITVVFALGFAGSVGFGSGWLGHFCSQLYLSVHC